VVVSVKAPWRVIRQEVSIEAPMEDVWEAWTTEKGVCSFFAPASRIDLRVGGAYEILFDPMAPPGERGAEGTRVLAFQRPRMLAFTWNAPPHLGDVRAQFTHVQIWLQAEEADRTLVMLIHSGWGAGGQWDEAFAYFGRAWGEVVLPTLAERFTRGPIDWSDPSGG